MKKIISLLLLPIVPAAFALSPIIGGGGGSGDALTTNPLSQFAATTSSQFKGVISDENAPDGASSKVIMALGSLSIASGKTATVSNTLTLAGTDSTTMTFPTTSATIARTDAANTFTGTQTFGAVVGTTWNGNTWATGTGTLSIAAGKTLTSSNTITLAGTDGTTITFPSTSATVARTDAANTFTGHQTIEGVTSTGATGTGKFVFDTSPTISGLLNSGITSGTQQAMVVSDTTGLFSVATIKRDANASTSGTPGTNLATMTAAGSKQLIHINCSANQASAASTQMTALITYSDSTTTTASTSASSTQSMFVNDASILISASGVTAHSAKKITIVAITTAGAGTGSRFASCSADEVPQ